MSASTRLEAQGLGGFAVCVAGYTYVGEYIYIYMAVLGNLQVEIVVLCQPPAPPPAHDPPPSNPHQNNSHMRSTRGFESLLVLVGPVCHPSWPHLFIDGRIYL